MAERTVKVNLVASVNGYIAGMDQAARRTRVLATEAERLAAKGQVFDQLGRGLIVFGAIAAAAVGIAVKKFAEFDQAMSQVNAVTQESADNMALLRDAAIDAGGATVFTAVEAANAIEELGKAGLSTADILEGALDGALALAASGQLEVARAAEITATTLKQFGLAGSEAGHVADVLSAGAGKALGSVEDLAQGLKFVGPVAASMGVSLEETTGALALFADQGIIGEQAGTSLRGVLSSLTSPSSQAATEIERLGINLYGANGAFLGLENVAGKLSDAYTNLDDKSRDASLGVIFGNQQVTAARVLFQGGAEAVAKYTSEVDDAGYAARVAADRLDNLTGDVEKLGGAFDSALIKSGTGANEVLRQLVQSATFLVDAIGNAPQPVLDVSLAIGAAAAATALAGGAALVAVPKFIAFRTALTTSGISARSAAGAIGLASGAITAATIILAAFINEQAASSGRVDEFTESLDKATGATTKYTRELVVRKLQEKGAFADAANYGISQLELTDAVLLGGEALESVNEKLAATSEGLTGNQKRAATLRSEYGTTATTIRTTRDEIEAAGDALRNTEAATVDSTTAYKESAERVAALRSNLSDLIATVNEANGVGQDIVTTNAAYQKSLADVNDYIKQAQDGVEGYTLTFDANTAAGSANQAMLANQADDLLAAAEAQLVLDGDTNRYISTVAAGQATILAQAEALGATDEQLRFIRESVIAIPSEKAVAILIETTEAQRRLNLINSTLDQITSRGLVLGAGSTRGDGSASANGNMFAYANGGIGEGIYSGGQPLYKFAEPETKWEAFISGRPGQEPRNRMIWAEAGQRLGVGSTAAGQGTPRFDVVVQSKGGIDLLKYVDVSIRQYDKEQTLSSDMGRVN